jgi:acetyl-CoA acyltransferase
MSGKATQGREVAIIDASRIPFAKAYGAYRDLDAQTLLNRAVQGLLSRTGVDKKEIDEVIAGAVLPSVSGPNMAREVVIDLSLPTSIPGFTLGRACTSSLQSSISGAEGILSGQYDCVISCGVESLSNVPVLFQKPVVDALIDMKKVAKAKTLGKKISELSKILKGVGLKNLKPKLPAIAERSTGMTMGEHAEVMAKKNQISREAQDKWAYESHKRAAKAIENGVLSEEITAITLGNGKYFEADDGVRGDVDMESLAKLRPAFDRKHGTLTAGNSSPLTDGASAMLLMEKEKAKAAGYPIKGYIRGWKTVALDPNDQLLIGPAVATPLLLDDMGISFKDIELLEVHEAFAAQVLSFTQAMNSKAFAKDYLNKESAVGEVNTDIMNVHGGSISIGHPFGATGNRVIGACVHEMNRRDLQWGLVTACAAGGMGTSMIIERTS